MRYTSHLDLHRTWERTIRRAGLPLAYSHGYNPRPRIQIAVALPLGFTSQLEVVDVWFEESVEVEAVQTALERAAPPGIKILDVQEIDLRSAALQTKSEAAEYTITLLEPIADLAERIELIRSAETLPRQRRGKHYDLRPLIEEIHRLPDDEQGNQRLHIRLAAREGATGRPEELLFEMGIPPHLTRVERTNLVFQE